MKQKLQKLKRKTEKLQTPKRDVYRMIIPNNYKFEIRLII